MIPIPLSDENPASRRPVVTVALIVLNFLAWFFELSRGVTESTLDYGAIPAWVLHGLRDGVLSLPVIGSVTLHQEVGWPWTIVTSMFMHGSWLHILGNMWFLWIFGDNVEDALGPIKYFVFYFVCGIVAALSQIYAQAGSTIPMVGASGAIAGVLGAYLMLYPRARVRCLWILVIFITTVYVPAWLLLGLWFVSQFFVAGADVAWMAHVGGFLAGFLLIRLLSKRPPPRRPGLPPLFARA